MCDSCGCNDEGKGYILINPAEKDTMHEHDHSHGFDHGHSHSHSHGHDHLHTAHHHNPPSQRITIETDILQKNNMLAQRNRGFFDAKNMLVLNMVSAPGSGKTTLLERTIRELAGMNTCVIEGDQQTALDAERIHNTGAPVIQVNTGNGCHLDAEMVYNAVKSLNPVNNAVLFIENVGNLVCPALFDLGEKLRVVIISVTEGDDKPLKYPNMFRSSQLCLINKTDLLPYVNFSVERFRENAGKVNPDLQFIEVSASTGDGFGEWINRIRRTGQTE
jgi:hydrogenase nickel incorporation protein HypB